VIFTAGEEQRSEASASQADAAMELARPVGALGVVIQPLQRFWPAEAYHQDYALRNPIPYRYYRWSCGRDRRLDAVWGSRARSSDEWVRQD
jgi:peptide-methionine (S)-S-oxide reductase